MRLSFISLIRGLVLLESVLMHRNAMRWFSRLKSPTQGTQAFIPYGNSGRICRRLPINFILPPRRELCSATRFRTKASPSTSPSTSSSESAPPASSRPPKPPNLAQAGSAPQQGPRWILLALIFGTSAGATYLYRRQSASPANDDVINTSIFTAFTITAREQVSPTAFIVTLRPSAWVDPDEIKSGHSAEGGDDGSAGFISARIREAWRHGLWSVEIKQPQLQIARHYTPLPPFPASVSSPITQAQGRLGNGDVNEPQAILQANGGLGHEEQDWQDDLRILIRRLDGGEMSNYLSRQRVGDTIWLRGPHLGFDIPRRLGHDSDIGNSGAAPPKGVVFLAGGTGIAPALQIAHKLLKGYDSGDGGRMRPQVSILWANRWGVDALGRSQSSSQQKLKSWFTFGGTAGNNQSVNAPGAEPASSLALQIRDLKQRYPSQFNIAYFVDEEGSFIKAQDVKAAIASTASSAPSRIEGSSSPSPHIGTCTWHSAKAIELLPDDNDAARSSSSDPVHACVCTRTSGSEVGVSIPQPGVNLVCVSGPDGFIEAYAGAKRWHDGHEMQGSIRGLLGKIRSDYVKGADEWLVLKL